MINYLPIFIAAFNDPYYKKQMQPTSLFCEISYRLNLSYFVAIHYLLNLRNAKPTVHPHTYS